MSLDQRVWFFDCDGVILNSNGVKTEAFRRVASQFGDHVADALVRYHVTHGGVSRFVKLQYLFSSILNRPAAKDEMEMLLAEFARLSSEGISSVASDESFAPLLELLKNRGASRYVASGGFQEEVRWELSRRSFEPLLDGVFGSPRTKTQIVGELMGSRHHAESAVFVGDSQQDWRTAEEFGMRFVFVRHWSEWSAWKTARQSDWIVVEDLSELLLSLNTQVTDSSGVSHRA